MHWYLWIPVGIWVLGLPVGVALACRHVSDFYVHPVMDGFDIIVTLITFLAQFLAAVAIWPILLALDKYDNKQPTMENKK